MLNISINLISVDKLMTMFATFGSGVFMIEAFRFDGEGKLRYTYVFVVNIIALCALLTYGFQNV